MNKILTGILICLAFPLLFSCNKDGYGSSEGAWLFPIAKGEFSLATLRNLRNTNYSATINPSNIGQPIGVVVNSPGLALDHVGPFAFRINDWLKRVDIDSLSISVSLDNAFPIPIGAGTIISIRNTNDVISNANIVSSVRIQQDILPGQRFAFDLKVLNKTLYDSVYFALDSFRSPPYNNVTFNTTPTLLQASLSIITSHYVEVYANKTISSKDTFEFDSGNQDNLGNNTGGIIHDSDVNGYLNVFLDNSVPANGKLQMYFLDATRTILLDSMFDFPITFLAVETDAAGTPQSVNSTLTKVPIRRGKLDNIRQAKYTITDFVVNTNSTSKPFVSANRQATLKMQFTGDLNIRISLQ